MIKGLLMHHPVLAVFDVTKRCNSRCNMCNIWKHPSKPSEELRIKEIRSIFADLKKFGIRLVLLQGGEPLLRRDIFEIIELMISLGLKPALVTNGILLNKSNINRLAGLKCNVSVSLDTLDRARYKRIRGVDTFNLVMRNLAYASSLKNKKSSWFINSTISAVNCDEAVKVYDFALRKGFNFFAYPYNYSLCKASARDSGLVFRNKEKVISSFNKLVINAREHKDIINEFIFKEVVKYLHNDYKIPCDALRYSLMINEKGEVGPCIELSQEFSLKNRSINEIWPLLNRERVKACFLKTPCFYGCTRTTGIIMNNLLSLSVSAVINRKVTSLLKSV